MIYQQLIARLALTLLLVLPCGSLFAVENQSLARDAYFQLEGNVFNRKEIESAIQKINRAVELNQNDPWVYLSASMFSLIRGYRIGDWYDQDTFAPGSIDEAIKLAQSALELDENISQTNAHLARILIVKGSYERAHELLNTAYQLDPDGYYPWYFKGILYEKMGAVQQAQEHLLKAIDYAHLPYQIRIAKKHLQNVAELADDFDLQEKLLRENISHAPDSPYMYGNYATFLMDRERYQEAITYWEKALARGRYKHAEKQLRKSQQLFAEQNNQ